LIEVLFKNGYVAIPKLELILKDGYMKVLSVFEEESNIEVDTL